MGKKREPKEIIGKLREAEVMLVQGGTVADACRRIGLRCRAGHLEEPSNFVVIASGRVPKA